MMDVGTGVTRALSDDVIASCEQLAQGMLRSAALPIDRHGVARPSSRRLYAFTCAAQVVTLRLLVSVGELRGVVFVAGESFVRESAWGELVAELRAVLDGQREAVWRALGVIVPTASVLAELESVEVEDDAVLTALDLLLLDAEGRARDWSEHAIDDLIDALSALWTAHPKASAHDPAGLVLERSTARPARSDERAILVLAERVAAWARGASREASVLDVHCGHGALMRSVLRQWAPWVADRPRVVHAIDGLEAHSLRVSLARLGLWWSAPYAIGDGRALEQRVRRIDRPGAFGEHAVSHPPSAVIADLRGVGADVLRAAVDAAPAGSALFFLIDRAWAEAELWAESRAFFDQHAQRDGLPTAVDAIDDAPLLVIATRRPAPLAARSAPAGSWTVGPYANGAGAALVAYLDTLPRLRAHFSAAPVVSLDERRILAIAAGAGRWRVSMGSRDGPAPVRLCAHCRSTPFELLALLRSSLVAWQLVERSSRLGLALASSSVATMLELAAPPSEASALRWDALYALGSELESAPDDPSILARIDQATAALYGLDEDARALIAAYASQPCGPDAPLTVEALEPQDGLATSIEPTFATPEGDARREAWAIANAAGIAGLSLFELCRRAREHTPDELAEAAQSLIEDGWLALTSDARVVARAVRASAAGATQE